MTMDDRRTGSLLGLPASRRSSGAVVDWVDSILGIGDRGGCLGGDAVSLAMARLQVSLELDPDLLFDGELRLVGDRKTIFLRRDIDSARKNFTIAHELGHAALFELDRELNQATPDIERVCNMFAAELLLPRSGVQHEVMRSGSFARALSVLAAKSGASLAATCIRITECFGGAAGVAAPDGTIVQSYGRFPRSVRLADELARVARSGLRSFKTVEVSDGWILDTGFVRSRYIYVLRAAVSANPPPAAGGLSPRRRPR